jgi:hypothetical protein
MEAFIDNKEIIYLRNSGQYFPTELKTDEIGIVQECYI